MNELVSVDDFDALVIILVCGVIGIANAMIFDTLNTRGIGVDQIVTANFTITSLMSIVIVLWLFIGVIVAAVKT